MFQLVYAYVYFTLLFSLVDDKVVYKVLHLKDGFLNNPLTEAVFKDFSKNIDDADKFKGLLRIVIHF